MSSAIVGFDVGSYSCYASVAKSGGIETIMNEHSDRCTSSCINFSKKSRSIGLAANLQLIADPENTINNFTSLVGKKISDTIFQNKLPYYHYKIFEDTDYVRIEVSYLGSNHEFRPEQLLAMLITKLKILTEKDLKMKIKKAVLNVPLFYTNTERMRLFYALNIAGIECLCLINDLSAVGLLYHSMRAQSISTSKIVAFVDIGYSNFQAVIIRFMKDKFIVLQVGYDPNLGGREFDRVIYKYLSRHFAEQYSVNVLDSKKAGLRLMVECEKIKKRLSANPAEFVVNIECLMNDKDVSAKIDRSLFEKQCEPLINRMKSVIKKMLKQYRSNHNDEEITSVEIIGGTSRIPCVKQAITDVFKKVPQTTLNADEAVSRGCAIQSAIMNTNCEIRRIEFYDIVPFGITLDTFKDVQMSDLIKLDVQKKASCRQESVAIDFTNKFYPLENKVELNGCSLIEICYTDLNEAPNNNKVIGHIKINHKNGSFENTCKMLLWYFIDKFGLFGINSLVMKSPKLANEETRKVDSENIDGNIPIDFKIYYLGNIPRDTFEEFRNKENEFISKDLEETERLNVKNRLEESINKCRNVIRISQNENDELLNHLTGIESWLSDKGEDEKKEKYFEHLRTIENIIKTVQTKIDINQNESNPLEELSCTPKNQILGDNQVKVPLDCHNKYSDHVRSRAISANNPISGHSAVNVSDDNVNLRSKYRLSHGCNTQTEFSAPKGPASNSANISKNPSKSLKNSKSKRQ